MKKTIIGIILVIIIVIAINIYINNKSNLVSKPQQNQSITHKKIVEINKLDYTNSKEIPNEILEQNKNSNPSIVIADEKGKVYASINENIKREGASTTKIFTGLAVLKLLDKNDKIIGTNYSIETCYPFNKNSIDVGQEMTVEEAATYIFPNSANTVATDIAVAIGKKYYNTNIDSEAAIKGVEKINSYIKEIGCNNTHLGNASGLNTTPTDNNNAFDKENGYPLENCIDGMTANDLTLATIKAMKEERFSQKIKNSKKEELYYIKSGRGVLCHGVWGFNKNRKKYYLTILGINCSNNINEISTKLYEYSINNLIN